MYLYISMLQQYLEPKTTCTHPNQSFQISSRVSYSDDDLVNWVLDLTKVEYVSEPLLVRH